MKAEDKFSLQQFAQWLRDWALEDRRNDELPSSPAALVALGYELWLAARTKDERRTLEKFANLLKTYLDKELSPATLWRKLKGRIRPDSDELRGILAVFINGGSKLTNDDAILLDRLVALIEKDLDLWNDPNVAWIFSSHGEGIVGHRDNRRMEFWRAVQSRRLDRLSKYNHLPLSVWLLDGADILRLDQQGYRARSAAIGLIQDLLAAFATPLTVEEDTLDVVSRRSLSVVPRVVAASSQITRSERAVIAGPRIRARRDSGIEIIPAAAKSEKDATHSNLTQQLLDTSIVGLIAPPQKILDAAKCTLPPAEEAFALGHGADPADPRVLLHEKLLPDWILNRSNLRLLSEDTKEPLPKALVDAINQRTAVLGTKLRPAELAEIGKLAGKPYSAYFDWSRDKELSVCNYAYWFHDQSPDEGNEYRLDRATTPREVQTAIEMLLLGAVGKLNPNDKNTVGTEMLNLLWRNGILLLNLREFFNVPCWFPLFGENPKQRP